MPRLAHEECYVKHAVVDSNGKLYESVGAATKATGLRSPSSISHACQATAIRSYKVAARLQWAYVDDHPENWPLHPVEAMKPESVPKPLIVPQN